MTTKTIISYIIIAIISLGSCKKEPLSEPINNESDGNSNKEEKKQEYDFSPFGIFQVYTSVNCGGCYISDHVHNDLYEAPENYFIILKPITFWDLYGPANYDPQGNDKFQQEWENLVTPISQRKIWLYGVNLTSLWTPLGVFGAPNSLRLAYGGSSEGAVELLKDSVASHTPTHGIILNIEETDNSLVKGSFSIRNPSMQYELSDVALHIVLVEDSLVWTPTAGENAHKEILRNNVARQSITIDLDNLNGEGEYNLSDIPEDVSFKNSHVIAYVEGKSWGKIYAAKRIEIFGK